MKSVFLLVFLITAAAQAIEAKSADEIKSSKVSCIKADRSKVSALACELAAIRAVKESIAAANQEIIQADRLRNSEGRKISNLAQYMSETTIQFQSYVDSQCEIETEQSKINTSIESQSAAVECEFSYKIDRLEFLEREALNEGRLNF